VKVPAVAFLALLPRGIFGRGVVRGGGGAGGLTAGADAGIDFVFELFGVLFDYTEAAFDGVVGRPGDNFLKAV
jgi:hypothetical protein